MRDEEESGRSPNARLQDRIILYLGRHDNVETVVGLSRALGSPRSSTSRAINRLKTDGLVQKVEGVWSLTERGHAEEARLRQRLDKRSKRARKEIDRIIRLQSEFERTVGSSTFKQINKTLRSMPEIPQALSGLDDAVRNVVKAQAIVPKTTPVIPKMPPITSKVPILPKIPSLAPNVSALQRAMGGLEPSPFWMRYRMRPFFEVMRLVDSVGVGSPSISSSLNAISESVRVNQSTHMKSISQVASPSSLASAKVEPLYSTLNLLNQRLGDIAFASVQVRAVEALLKRITSSAIPLNAFKAIAPQVEFASGKVVRQILEQADIGTLLDDLSSASLADVPFGSLADAPSSTLEDMDATTSEEETVSSRPPTENLFEPLPAQTWDELPEAVKLRFVAVATFIVLHVAFIAAQNQPDGSQYIKDLVIALTGTAAVVAICKELELFKEK